MPSSSIVLLCKKKKPFFFSLAGKVEESWIREQGTWKGKWSLPLMNSKQILDTLSQKRKTSKVRRKKSAKYVEDLPYFYKSQNLDKSTQKAE